jgi:hypothetical protein
MKLGCQYKLAAFHFFKKGVTGAFLCTLIA